MNNTFSVGSSSPDFQVIVIGAGPGGIAAGVFLKKSNIDFCVLERANAVGGSWRDNDYPDIGVDVPFFLYQYSFARKADWARLFPKGDEVRQYHVDVAVNQGLMPHIRFNTEVVKEVWNEEHHYWHLHLANGETLTARFVIKAVGAFIQPKSDDGLKGLENYKGKIQKPTEWDHHYELTGKRVAVIGTGASSVQISPAIASMVESLDVYQRTPVYCFPKVDIKNNFLFRNLLRIPGFVALLNGILLVVIEIVLRLILTTPLTFAKRILHRFDRIGKRRYGLLVKRAVKDQEVAQALIPAYSIAVKRPTISNKFLQIFNRDNTSLVTTPIDTFTKKGIKTQDGVEHEYDMVVVATGYKMFSDPESYPRGTVIGRHGVDLGAFFMEHKLQAYDSVSIPNFPNRWMLIGPYSWTGTGWHFMVETSARHAVRVIKEVLKRKASFADISREAHDAYHNKLKKRERALKYYFTELNAGVNTYFVNSQGDVPYIRPTTAFEALWNSYRLPLTDYQYETVENTNQPECCFGC